MYSKQVGVTNTLRASIEKDLSDNEENFVFKIDH